MAAKWAGVYAAKLQTHEGFVALGDQVLDIQRFLGESPK